jgi:hypothetical protein
MLPPKEGILFDDDPVVTSLSTHTGASEGQSASSGTSGMVGTSASHASSSMVSTSNNESDNTTVSSANTTGSSETAGWSSGWNEGHGVAYQRGENEAWTRGTNRSTTSGTTVTNSVSVTDGFSDTVGKTVSRGEAVTAGETITHGKSVTLSPFYEYVREEIEAPTFMTPEEQKLLEMQRLAHIPKQHAMVITPNSTDCTFRVTDVPDPTITRRRLAAGEAFVHRNVKGYPLIAPQQGEIIDVEAREVQPVKALRSPAPVPIAVQVDAAAEAKLWERVYAMGHARQEKS